jgi:hypothetical protein
MNQIGRGNAGGEKGRGLQKSMGNVFFNLDVIWKPLDR